MRIYAVADIHGKPEKIKRITAVIRHRMPDILVIAGDISGLFSPLNSLALLKEIPIPILCVRGNSDSKPTQNFLQGSKTITFLTHEPVTCLGHRLMGLNGTLPLPFFSKVGLFEAPLFQSLEDHMTRETILVVHPPPRGVCDRVANRWCAGSVQLRRFIENHPPLLVLCGHIHEQAGHGFLNSTLVVNCAMNKTFSGAVIDCDRDRPLTVNMILNDKQTDKGQ